MRQVFRFDEEGYYVEPVIIENWKAIPTDCTDLPLPNPIYMPKWDGAKWVEMATEDEINKMTKPQSSPLELLIKQQTDLTFALMEKGVL